MMLTINKPNVCGSSRAYCSTEAQRLWLKPRLLQYRSLTSVAQAAPTAVQKPNVCGSSHTLTIVEFLFSLRALQFFMTLNSNAVKTGVSRMSRNKVIMIVCIHRSRGSEADIAF